MCLVLVLGTATVQLCSHASFVLSSTNDSFTFFAVEVDQLRQKNELANDMKENDQINLHLPAGDDVYGRSWAHQRFYYGAGIFARKSIYY